MSSAKDGRFDPCAPLLGTVVPDQIARAVDLDSDEKLLIARLRRYMRAKGYCWPAQRTLALELGVSRGTLQRTIGKLVKKGIVATRMDRSRRSLVYEFLPHPVWKTPLELWKSGPDVGRGGPEGGQGVAHLVGTEDTHSESYSGKRKEQMRLRFDPQKKKPEREHAGAEAGRRRAVGLCRCGFKGRPVWVDGAGEPVEIGDCPRCHRLGYAMERTEASG